MTATSLSSQRRAGQRQRRATRIARASLFYIVVTPLLLLWLVPMFGALLVALRSADDLFAHGPWSMPERIAWENFAEAWTRGGLGRYLLNSFIITIPAITATLLLASMAAFALARYRFRGNRLIYIMFIAGSMLPAQILMLPVFRLTNVLHIYDTYWALIIFHTAFQLGFCTFVLRNFMRTIPSGIFDAGRIDGCTDGTLFRRIALPLSLPALAAMGTLEFTWVFNDYLWGIVLVRSNEYKPVAAGLATLLGQFTRQWNILFAGALLAVLPTVLLFLFLQRYFISGLTLGSGK